MRYRTSCVAIAAVSAIAAASACSDSPGVTYPQQQDVPRSALVQALTATAAANVGSDGRFPLARPIDTGRPQILEPQAGALAVAIARYNLPYSREVFDRQHGGPIAYQKVAICGQPVYAASAFARLSDDVSSSAAHPLQKALGPWWLVTLCAPSGEPQLKLAVSAYSTDLQIDERGQVVFPAIGGNDFLAEGIPSSGVDDDLPSPEAAVVLAAKLSGRRVAQAPELVAPFYKENSPLGARWRIRLDGPAHMQLGDGSTVEATEVFISRTPRAGSSKQRTWAVDAAQPADVEALLVPLGRVGESKEAYEQRQQTEMRTVRVSRRPEVPIVFTPGAVAP